MKVKFVSDAIIRTEVGTEKLFSQGDVVDLNAASAERWIRRGVAADVTVVTAEDKPAPVTKKAKKKAKKK